MAKTHLEADLNSFSLQLDLENPVHLVAGLIDDAFRAGDRIVSFVDVDGERFFIPLDKVTFIRLAAIEPAL